MRSHDQFNTSVYSFNTSVYSFNTSVYSFNTSVYSFNTSVYGYDDGDRCVYSGHAAASTERYLTRRDGAL